MSNEVATLTEGQLVRTLQSSLYPGAADASVYLVLDYCKAAKLDPLQKPVHIVPMTVKRKGANGERDSYDKVDTIMPGIGLYRIQAARTGEYAGQDRPVFGPILTRSFVKVVRTWAPKAGSDKKVPTDTPTDVGVDYPEWCEVTVYRIVKGQKVSFTALEYWDENYATAGRDSDAPNEMWAKRARGQLAKCAEAQALRKAFPEAVGSAPTAEEMEGKHFFDPNAQPAPALIAADPSKPEPADWPPIPQELLDLGDTAADAGERVYGLWWMDTLKKEERQLLKHRHAGWKARATKADTIEAGDLGTPAGEHPADGGANDAAEPVDDWGAAYETEEKKGGKQ